METSTLFTPQPGHWYAADFITDTPEFSPIRVESFQRKPGTQSSFLLAFLHLNYPEGVQDKVYELRRVERGKQFLVGHTPHSFANILYVHPLSWTWLEFHFPESAVHARRLVGENADAAEGIARLLSSAG